MGEPAVTLFVDVTISIQDAVASKFQFGTLMFVTLHLVTANRQDGPFFSEAELEAAGFTIAAAANLRAWAADVFAQDDGVDFILVGRVDAADVDFTATMDAIEAEDADSWYITNIESRLAADILLVGAWTETRVKIYMAQSSDADIIAGGGGNVAETLQTNNFNRTALWWHVTDGEYLDGAISSSGGGQNLDAPNGAGIWAYRQLESIPFDTIEASEFANILSFSANAFGRKKGLAFSFRGSMASGRFIDITTSADWVEQRSEEAVIQRFVNENKVSFTNAGINIIGGDLQEVLDQGVTNSHFGDDVTDPVVVLFDVSEVSSTDKALRELTLEGEAVFGGAIQKVFYNLTLTP